MSPNIRKHETCVTKNREYFFINRYNVQTSWNCEEIFQRILDMTTILQGKNPKGLSGKGCRFELDLILYCPQVARPQRDRNSQSLCKAKYLFSMNKNVKIYSECCQMFAITKTS